jgi:GTPase Era involved in 16S rRNA processing
MFEFFFDFFKDVGQAIEDHRAVSRALKAMKHSTNRPAPYYTPLPLKKSTLELNFERLDSELMEFKYSTQCKCIAILGQPGAGKSTLLKEISNGEVSPPPLIGGQTDATTWAESESVNLLSFWRNYKNTVVFADAPGYDTSAHPVDAYLAHFPFYSFSNYLLVISGKIHSADEQIYRKLVNKGRSIYVIRCFSESLSEDEKVAACSDIQIRFPSITQSKVIFVSNRTGDGITEIQRLLGL